MIQGLKRIMKLLAALMKLLPVLIDIVEDFADDGERNHSTGKPAGKSSPKA